MLSINMRVFKTVLLLVVFISSRVECLPVANETTIVDPTTVLPSSSDVDHYDQRQNGTENFRVHVDGVVFVFAPVEALLLANAVGNKPNLPIPDPSKPTPDKPEIGQKPSAAPKSANRIGSRLTNLLAPFLPALRRE
ncbi:uncharacterized protein LOC116427564 [Nomia melanderi]|uniref:uncharacterized protein LOC116427564 n=1 Tax=Nomia melanderi TaxID=2448451 RepID=UPI0013041592|nr:uncharacterized protein LOC116427564 [Nomia melanderi]